MTTNQYFFAVRMAGLALMFILSWSSAQAAPPLADKITSVDIGSSPPLLGFFTSLAVVDGQPAISYYSVLERDLKYTRFDGTTWHTMVVDSDIWGNVGDWADMWACLSLAEVAGQPAISYYHQVDDVLKYAHFDGTTWQITTVDSVDAPYVGVASSLAVVDGQPAISYLAAARPNRDYILKYAHFDDATWITTTVDSNVDRSISLSLAVIGGQPAISYAGAGLKYASFDGTIWITTTVDSDVALYGSKISMAKVAGQPAISYYDQANDELKYAHFDGTAWQITTVDSRAANREFKTSSLTDVDGQPAIIYFGDSLKYAQFDGTTWQITVLKAIPGLHLDNSLTMVDDQPAFSFSLYDWTFLSGLWYVRFDGLNWQWQQIDIGTSPGIAGPHNSLAEVAGQPAISYIDNSIVIFGDYTRGRLKYAHFDGTMWVSTVVVTEGVRYADTSLVEVDGQPAISYYAHNFVNYAHFDGTTWMTMIVDSTSPSQGLESSMAVVDGLPAMSYVSGRELKYARFDGTSWLTSTVDSARVIGDNSLAVVNGQPAISYALDHRLRYAYFDGTTWLTTTVDSGERVMDTSLAIVDNQPAISYIVYGRSSNDTDNYYYDLRYARFEGSLWITTTVDSRVFEGGTSLAVVDGHPVISYHDRTNGIDAIMYAYSEGTTWHSRMVSRGKYTSLAVVAGQPAISYFDNASSANGGLKYVQLDTTIPSEWEMFLPLVSN